jgi:predicted MFS family arabinose efflux permease
MSLRKTTRSPQTPFCGKRGAIGEKHILAFLANQGIARRSNRARWALSLLFLVYGLTFGTWAALIPSFQEKFHLSAGTLSWVLLGMISGALVSMPLTGRLIGHYGSDRHAGANIAAVTTMGYLVFLAGPPLIGFIGAAWLGLPRAFALVVISGILIATVGVAVIRQARTAGSEDAAGTALAGARSDLSAAHPVRRLLRESCTVPLAPARQPHFPFELGVRAGEQPVRTTLVF